MVESSKCKSVTVQTAARKKLFERLCGVNNQDVLHTSCATFKSDKTKNPLTKKSIKKGSDIYNFYDDLCTTFANQSTSPMTKGVKATTSSQQTQQTHSMTSKQVALDDMIEQKIVSYILVIDEYYHKKFAAKSKTLVSPIDWLFKVKMVDSRVSRVYDNWIASGNEPVREFVVSELLTNDTLKPDAITQPYCDALKEMGTTFFNIQSELSLVQLDDMFQKAKDHVMAKNTTAQMPDIHAEREERRLTVAKVVDIENQVLHVFANRGKREEADHQFVNSELGYLTKRLHDSTLSHYCHKLYQYLDEAAIQNNELNANLIKSAFKQARRVLFKV